MSKIKNLIGQAVNVYNDKEKRTKIRAIIEWLKKGIGFFKKIWPKKKA